MVRIKIPTGTIYKKEFCIFSHGANAKDTISNSYNLHQPHDLLTTFKLQQPLTPEHYLTYDLKIPIRCHTTTSLLPSDHLLMFE